MAATCASRVRCEDGANAPRALHEFWSPQYKKDIKLLECPKEGTKTVKVLKEEPYEKLLIHFPGSAWRRLRGASPSP